MRMHAHAYTRARVHAHMQTCTHEALQAPSLWLLSTPTAQ